MAADATAPEDVPRESAGCVLGIGLALVGLLGALGFLASLVFLDGSVDGAARVEEWYPDGAPFGFELDDARIEPFGRTVVVKLGRPAGALPRGQDDPEELVLLEFDTSQAVDDLFTANGDDERGDAWTTRAWSDDPSFAFHVVRDGGDVVWDGWKARYLVVRAMREGGGWRESARVDVSRPGRHRVLLAQWPVGTLAREDVVRELLRPLALD